MGGRAGMRPVELVAELAYPARAELGEGPVWDDLTQALVWVDIMAGRVHRLDWRSGFHRVLDVGVSVGAVGLRRIQPGSSKGPGLDAGLVLAVADGFALSGPISGPEPLAELSLERLAEPSVDTSAVRFNEGKVDPEGRWCAGTMSWDESEPVGALYLLHPSGSVQRLVDGVTVSNGMDWSEDGRTFYYVDSATGRVDAFDRDPETGALSARRLVVEIARQDGIPDGMTLDAEGCIWVALWRGAAVRRYTPDGRLDRVLALPATKVTSMAFGGPGLDELFVTTARIMQSGRALAAEPRAGDVFWCRPGTSGRPPFRYGAT